VHLHVVEVHVESHIGRVQKIVGEIFLDDVALVTAADHEIVDAVMAVGLEDVPEDGLAAHLHHGLGPQVRFFCQAGAEATGENDCLHPEHEILPSQCCTGHLGRRLS